ncbi:esterase/lipase superfamily enzyme [Pedobacter psychrotolerans]|uniref:Esterase n=1 Tax=Pedobacter psychrotolerans TaxID=1843235 RepID=A0A4R2HII3_9SPHI|nr:alpha/beta hydrolase-fold protein [Pedobacter psychrotolerans]TCO26743.1 esterase/lipase superfamily enzyme [Pedobacter psychrotolerans]GGE56129.1 esterase [Pedobacter psychrotolerans]
MREEHKKWYSPNLSTDIDMLIFGHAGIPVLLFPTSMGRYYENKDFKLIDAVEGFIKEGKIKVYCPDSIDKLSWYNKSIHPADRVKNHIWYDKYLLEEVAPLARNETGSNKIITAGCSFGGYHAANFAFRHPWLVSHMFSMSGAFDIKGQLDGFYNDDVYFNNPVDNLMNNSNPELHHMKIVLGTTDRDMCRADNENLSGILAKKGIDHWLDIRQNADHDWPIWREMFPSYIAQL